MGRAPRIEFPGAIYHVMNRGDQLEPIYADDRDRHTFLKILGQTCRAAGWRVHSFVLMQNHYHLLIETLRSTLVRGMQYLNSCYTRRYNLRHKIFGHLFQGRYKALLVDPEAESHFLTVSDYIHMNPVRIGRAQNLMELAADPWSSAGWLMGLRKSAPRWLCWETIFGELGFPVWTQQTQEEYQRYLDGRLSAALQETQLNPLKSNWCLGSEKFATNAKRTLDDRIVVPESWTGELADELEEDRAQKLLEHGAKILGYDSSQAVSGADRYLLARWVRTQSRVPMRWLTQKLSIKTVGGLSNGIYLIGERIREQPDFAKRWSLLQNVIISGLTP